MTTRTPLDPTVSNPGCIVDGSPSVVMVTDDAGVNLFYCEVHDPGEEPTEEETTAEEAVETPAEEAAEPVPDTPATEEPTT